MPALKRIKHLKAEQAIKDRAFDSIVESIDQYPSGNTAPLLVKALDRIAKRYHTMGAAQARRHTLAVLGDFEAKGFSESEDDELTSQIYAVWEKAHSEGYEEATDEFAGFDFDHNNIPEDPDTPELEELEELVRYGD